MDTMDQLVTCGEAADVLGVSRVTIWRRARKGRGPIVPVGRAGRDGPFLFRLADVQRAADQLARDAADAVERATALAA